MTRVPYALSIISAPTKKAPHNRLVGKRAGLLSASIKNQTASKLLNQVIRGLGSLLEGVEAKLGGMVFAN